MIYKAQRSQAQLESEAHAVAMWWTLGDEGNKIK